MARDGHSRGPGGTPTTPIRHDVEDWRMQLSAATVLCGCEGAFSNLEMERKLRMLKRNHLEAYLAKLMTVGSRWRPKSLGKTWFYDGRCGGSRRLMVWIILDLLLDHSGRIVVSGWNCQSQ